MRENQSFHDDNAEKSLIHNMAFAKAKAKVNTLKKIPSP